MYRGLLFVMSKIRTVKVVLQVSLMYFLSLVLLYLTMNVILFRRFRKISELYVFNIFDVSFFLIFNWTCLVPDFNCQKSPFFKGQVLPKITVKKGM